MSLMGETTKIAWCDSTVNAQMGCDGCELWLPDFHACYAGIEHERRAGNPGWPKAFDKPELFTYRIGDALRWDDLAGTKRPEKPWLNGLPRVIFLDDEGDTFTESLDLFWLRPFVEGMGQSPHLWLPLTKRPRRAAQFFRECGAPGNFWVGTSITNQATAEARIPALLNVPARIHFVSCEPLLGPVSLGSRLLDGVDWVIAGGLSGRFFAPVPEDWFRTIRNQCVDAGVPFFFKQHPSRFSETDPNLDGREWREMPRN